MPLRFTTLILLLSLSPMVRADAPTPRAGVDRLGDPLPTGALARLGSVRLRFQETIHGVAFAPDGKTLAAACTGPGGTDTLKVCFYHTATGKQRLSLEEKYNLEIVAGLSFSPRGDLLAVRAHAHHISLWDTASGHLIRRLETRPAGPASRNRFGPLDFSPDGKLLAAEGAPGEVCLWEVATGRKLPPLGKHTAAVAALRFSIDGQRLLSSNTEGRTVCVWEVATGKKLHERAIPSELIALSPDGRSIACSKGPTLPAPSSEEAPAVALLDLETGLERARITFGNGLGDRIYNFLFSPDGKTLATNTEVVALWDVGTGKELRRFQGGLWHGTVLQAFSQDGRLLASMTGQWPHWGRDVVRLWHVATGREVRLSDGHREEVSCVACAPDAKVVASGSRDGSICLWEPATGRELRRLEGHRYDICALAFSPDGLTLASAGWDATVRLWDPITGQERCRLTTPKRNISTLVFATDGRLGVAYADGTVQTWYVGSGKELSRVRYDQAEQVQAALSGNLSMAVFGDAPLWKKTDGTLRLVRIPSGRKLLTLDIGRPADPPNTRTSYRRTLAFSADGRLLASSEYPIIESYHGSTDSIMSGSSTLRVRETVSGNDLLRPEEVDGGPRLLGLSSDGRTLAYRIGMEQPEGGGRRDVVFLRDVLTGAELGRLQGHLGEVRCFAFAPDGQTAFTGSEDSTLLVWDLSGMRPPALVGASRLTEGAIDELWRRLAAADPVLARRAIDRLVNSPEQAVPLLRQRLRAATPPDPESVARLIRDLGSERYAARARAMAELEWLGRLAEPALRQALQAKPALEMSRRLGSLLAGVEPAPPTGERLRALRCLEVLERIGSPEARRVLLDLASGAADASLTQEALAVVDRLPRRHRAAP